MKNTIKSIPTQSSKCLCVMYYCTKAMGLVCTYVIIHECVCAIYIYVGTSNRGRRQIPYLSVSQSRDAVQNGTRWSLSCVYQFQEYGNMTNWLSNWWQWPQNVILTFPTWRRCPWSCMQYACCNIHQVCIVASFDLFHALSFRWCNAVKMPSSLLRMRYTVWQNWWITGMFLPLSVAKKCEWSLSSCVYLQNKLIQVQSRFPHDSLRLNEPMDLLHVGNLEDGVGDPVWLLPVFCHVGTCCQEEQVCF